MPKVFLPQAPNKRDPETGKFTKQLDFSVASAYGVLQAPIFDPWGIGFPATREHYHKAREVLKGYQDGDSILAAGDPAGIALCCVIAAQQNNGRFSLLRWHGASRQYVKLDFDTR